MGVCTSTKNFKTDFSMEEIGNAMKQSLDLAAKFAEDKTAGEGKFADNEAIRIKLPDELLDIKTQIDGNQEKLDQMMLDKVIDDSLLQEFNVGERLVDLELQMNQAAEQACIGCSKIFIEAIKDISVESVMELLQGDDQAAFTKFLRQECEAPLTEKMTPVIEHEMGKVGFTESWTKFQEKYKEIKEKLEGGSGVKAMAMGALKAITGVEGLPELDFDMNAYLIGKIMEALFGFLADKETEMRQAPKLVPNDLVAGVFNKYCGKKEDGSKDAGEADPEQVGLSEKEPLMKGEEKPEAEEAAAAS